MKAHNKSFAEMKKEMDDSLTDVTKCYLLIKYAFNTEEETKKYNEEFKKRYINYYKTIIDLENELDERLLPGLSSEFKLLLNTAYYKDGMKFLKNISLDEIGENDEEIDADYQKKASLGAVKVNFYHNNKVEFGRNTRFHVNTAKNETIDPIAKTEEEKTYIFAALTNHFIEMYSDGLCKTNKTLMKKGM